MSVSLIALRLEISSEYPLLPHIHFSTSRPKRPMASTDSSSQREVKSLTSTPVESSKKTPVDKFRGLREVQEISVETIKSDDKQKKKLKKSKTNEKISTSTHSETSETKAVTPEPEIITKTDSVTTTASQTLDVSNAVMPELEIIAKTDSVTTTASQTLDVSRDEDIQQDALSVSPGEVSDVHIPTSNESVESNALSKDGTPDANDTISDRRNRIAHLTTPIQFSSGNHFVEVTKGVLHLYKENQRTTLAEEAERSEMLCIVGVPAVYTTHDLLKFTGPVSDDIEHLRIIRESKPNQYMVLLKFRNQLSADEFYKNFNGLKFNSIEDEVCHLAYVAKVETVKESEEACLPIPGHTELPTCPVCLERMDESVEGILTILCNHSFHGSCLAKWGDTSCPVCRYCQTPEPEPDNRCFGCGSQDSLWICLICGHIGCGRYVDGHAYEHYRDTQHTYAMQLGNNRVWDYAGDNYVHRLVQNKTDGKLVELEPRWAENEEKLDSMQLEYTYLLTSQLEAQRHYFEFKISRLETEAINQLEEMKEKTKHAVDERKQLEERLNKVTKDKQAIDKKLAQVTSKLNKMGSELKDERELNKSLRQNQHLWQQKLAVTEKSLKEQKEEKEKEIQDLQEQVRDLMFYFEAQTKLQDVPNVSSQEIQEGQIVIGEAAGPSNETSKQRRKKHR